MSRLDHLFQQFLRERTYITNVTPKTRQWYESAWKAFTAAQKVAPTPISRTDPESADQQKLFVGHSANGGKLCRS